MPSILNSDDGVVSGTSGLKSTGGNDGLLNIQSNGSTIVAVTGSGISVTGTVSQTGVSTFAAGTVSAPSITFTGDTNTGIFSPAADTIAFTEGGVESMRIDASGNVGIGVTPSAWFSLQKSVQLGGTFSGTTRAGALAAQTNDAVVQLFNNTYVNTSNVDTYFATGEAAKYRINRNSHEWYVAPSGTAGNAITFTQAMTLNASGGLQCLNTVGVGNATPSTSGAGITFPATQSASSNANTLDDYEEGTWTPTFAAGTWTYTSQTGKYTKIGNTIICSCLIIWTARPNTVDTFGVNLPFPTGGVSTDRFCGAFGYLDGVDTAGCVQINLTASGNGTTAAYVWGINDNAGPTAIQNGGISGSGEFQMSICYQV